LICDFQISCLAGNIQELQSSLREIRENSATQVRLLQEQLDSKHEQISRLEARLDAQRDYEELRRELLHLKGSSANLNNNNNNTTTSNNNISSNPSVDTCMNGLDAKDAKEKRNSE